MNECQFECGIVSEYKYLCVSVSVSGSMNLSFCVDFSFCCIIKQLEHISGTEFPFSFRCDEVQLLVGCKLVLFQQMFCSRESTSCLIIQENEKSTHNLVRKIWEKSSVPTKGMGKATDKYCDYRNKHIFMLRCINRGLHQLVSGLKTTIKTEKARKIIRKPKRDLFRS